MAHFLQKYMANNKIYSKIMPLYCQLFSLFLMASKITFYQMVWCMKLHYKQLNTKQFWQIFNPLETLCHMLCPKQWLWANLGPSLHLKGGRDGLWKHSLGLRNILSHQTPIGLFLFHLFLNPECFIENMHTWHFFLHNNTKQYNHFCK